MNFCDNLAHLTIAIRTARGALHWTQADLAEKSGISVASFLRQCVAQVVAGPQGHSLGAEDRLTLLLEHAAPRSFSSKLNEKAQAGQ